jgi:hypothetical protein
MPQILFLDPKFPSTWAAKFGGNDRTQGDTSYISLHVDKTADRITKHTGMFGMGTVEPMSCRSALSVLTPTFRWGYAVTLQSSSRDSWKCRPLREERIVLSTYVRSPPPLDHPRIVPA